MTRHRIARSILLATTALAAAGLASAPAMAAEEEDTEGGLGIITVTAQKREQSVQDVPIAVTALSGDTLQANRVVDVTDLSGLAPGVTVRTAAGGSKLPSFTIRGAVSYGVVPGSDKEVSIYLDGVYLSNPRGSIFELPDVERIEMLRGPQGTLFGRNATAGAVSIYTREPNGEFGVRATGTVGNRDHYRVHVGVDLPQFGPFSAYVSYVHNEKRGDIRNLNAGQAWDRTAAATRQVAKIQRSPKWLGSKNADSWFLAVKFESGDFKTVYRYDDMQADDTPEGTSFLGYNQNLGTLSNFLGALFSSQTANGFPAVLFATDGLRPKAVNNSFSIPVYQTVSGHSLTSTYVISDRLTAKNIFAYRKSYLFATSAIDGFSGLTITPQAAPLLGLPAFLVGSPFVGIASQPESRSQQTSDELQLNYESDFLTATVGASWFMSRDWTNEHRMQSSVSFSPVFLSTFTQRGIGETYNKAVSVAAFGQFEFHVTSQIDVILGGRITRDKKTGYFLFGPNPATLRNIPFSYKKSKPTFLVGVNYKPTDDILVYAKYSTGFVSGGTVAGIPFAPETVTSWEAGIKAEMLNRKLRANLALFRARYKHVQTAQAAFNFVAQITAITGDPTRAASIGTFVADQGGPVTATGFEFDLTAAPLDGLTMGGSLSYTKTTFKAVSAILISANGGDYQPTFRPKWTAGLWAQYDTPPIGAGDAYISARVDANWQSTISLRQNPALPAYATFAKGISQIKAYWMVNGRIALKDIELGGVKTTLAVWGKNLTDTREKTFALNLAQIFASANFVPARSYGIDFTIEF